MTRRRVLPGLTLVLLAACGTGPAAGMRPRAEEPAQGSEGLPPVTACADAPLVTLDQIAAGQHAGDRVALDGVPEPSWACTDMRCPPDDRCCNGCGGPYVMRLGDRLRVELQGLPGCRGTNCGDIRCEPFGMRPTRRYRFVGKNDFEPISPNGMADSRSRFKVEKVCRVE